MFFLLYRQTDYSVFDDFQKISDYLPKISKDSKVTQMLRNIFRKFLKITENFRRFPKIVEDCQRLSRKTQICFSHTPTNSSTI